MNLKELAQKTMQKKYTFMETEVKINKLSVAQVLEIQGLAKESEGQDDLEGLKVLKTVVKNGVEGGAELEDKDFEAFPMDELAKLSNAILEFSGIKDKSTGK